MKLNEKFGWLPELDRLLIAGIKHGPAQKRDAINEDPSACSRLDPRGLLAAYPRSAEEPRTCGSGRRAIPDKAKNPGKTRQVRRPPSMPWTPAHDDKLFNLAGYEPVNKIARRLRRSDRAVRCRLGALGISGKVTDGWSLRTLQKMLRVSRCPTKVSHRNWHAQSARPAHIGKLAGSAISTRVDDFVGLDSSKESRCFANGDGGLPLGTGSESSRRTRGPGAKPGFPPVNCTWRTRLSPTGRLRSSAKSMERNSILRH